MAFAVVYHMEGYEPKQLLQLQKHHRREDRDKYDLEHCDPALIGLNEIIHGDHDWAENLLAEVEAYKELNLRNEVNALRKRGRPGPAERRRVKGGEDPWKASGKLGPVRSILLTADAEFFAKEGFEDFDGHQFRDPAKVAQFRDLAIAFLDKHIPRKHCVFMSLELDEKTPHLHAYYRAWNEKDTKTKGVQRMLQPTDMIHFRNAEKAQDAVAEWFAPMGLKRGREIAKARREARAKGQMPPDKPERIEPWQWRQSERMKLVAAEKKARASEAEEKKMRLAAAAEREALSQAILEDDRRRERKEREHMARLKKADKERAERIKEEDRQRAERDKAAEVEKKTGLLVSALREFNDLGEAVKTAARKVGLVDHPLVQTAGRAVARMREMIGNLGGDQRQR